MDYQDCELFVLAGKKKIKIDAYFLFKFIQLAQDIFDEKVENYNEDKLSNYIVIKAIDIFKKEIPACKDAIDLVDFYDHDALDYYYILTYVFEDSFSTFISDHPEIGGNLKKSK